MSAQIFKLFGIGFQSPTVHCRVVKLQGIARENEVFGQRRRHDESRIGQVEEVAHGLETHVVGVHLAVGGVSGYVGRTNVHRIQQVEVYFRLVFPRVYGRLAHLARAHGIQQSGVVHHLAPACVHYERTFGQAIEEPPVGHVPRGVRFVAGQGHMKGDDIGLGGYPFETHIAGTTLGRVAHEHLHASRLRHLHDLCAHMAAAHDAHSGSARVEYVVAVEQKQQRAHILLHRRGVASRAVAPRYACLGEIFRVEVVVADGGRGDELHTASFQQTGVAARAGAHNQRVSIAHVGGRDALPFLIYRLHTHASHSFADVGYAVVYHKLHSGRKSTQISDKKVGYSVKKRHFVGRLEKII